MNPKLWPRAKFAYRRKTTRRTGSPAPPTPALGPTVPALNHGQGFGPEADEGTPFDACWNLCKGLSRRMARPRKQKHEQRIIPVPTRYTVAEQHYIRAQAVAAGLTDSDYIRRRALGYRVEPPKSPVDAALVTELNAIGVNLNQIARALNRGRDEPDHIGPVLDQLQDALDKVLDRYGS